jgi:hypothetical protein
MCLRRNANVLIRRTLKKSVLTQWKSHAVTVLQSVNVKTPIPIAMCDQVVDPKGEAIWKLKAYNGRVVASWLPLPLWLKPLSVQTVGSHTHK